MRQKTAPPTVLVLVRHGVTPTTGKELPEAGPGPSLTSTGREQAEQAGGHIRAWRPSLPPMQAVYASPMRRAQETAAVVAAALDLEVTEAAGLADCDTGEWAGGKLADLSRKAEWSTVVHHPSGFRFPGGETLAGMQARAVATVRGLLERHAGQTVVAVSHADPIKSVLADAMGMHLDLFQRLVVGPASVSAISYSPTGPTVMFANWAPPPPPPAPSPRAGRAARRPH